MTSIEIVGFTFDVLQTATLFRAGGVGALFALVLLMGAFPADGRAPVQGFDPIITLDRYYWPLQNANVVIDLDPKKCPAIVAGRSYTVTLVLPSGWTNGPKPFQLLGGQKVTKTVRTGAVLGAATVKALVYDGETKKAEGRFTTEVSPVILGVVVGPGDAG